MATCAGVWLCYEGVVHALASHYGVSANSDDGPVSSFFFFQAEDGIRDIGVTGVQTCALPISRLALTRLRNPRSARPRSGGWRKKPPADARKERPPNAPSTRRPRRESAKRTSVAATTRRLSARPRPRPRNASEMTKPSQKPRHSLPVLRSRRSARAVSFRKPRRKRRRDRHVAALAPPVRRRPQSPLEAERSGAADGSR